MATYDFAALDGTTFAFDPAADTLAFATGSAGQLAFLATGGGLQVRIGTHFVVLAGVGYGNLQGSSLAFADGSRFLIGGGGAEKLVGSAGADWLDGRGGADTLVGGDGNDVYVVTQAGAIVYEASATGGIDEVRTSLANYTLGANVENLRLLAAGSANGTGNALANVLFAGAGDNVLNGGAGVDTVSYAYATGGVSLWLALASAQATGGSGSDTLLNLENAIGSDFADSLRGNALANALDGGAGDDTLDGGGGADRLAGGGGNDTFYVDQAGDVVVEDDATAAGGIDLVVSLLAATTLGANVENLRLASTGLADGTGNGLDNTLWAGAGDNRLNGVGGIDTVSYALASGAITVSLALTGAQATGGSGTDTLLNVENLVGSAYADALTGNALANRLDGGAGADTLTGGLGADTMTGGAGNDVYQVYDAGDVVVETDAGAAGGTDRVDAWTSCTLAANVENLRLLGTADIVATGNALDNVFQVGFGSATLDGAGGIDTLDFSAMTERANVDLALGTGGSTNNARTIHLALAGFENLVGTRFNDSLVGDAGANRIEAGAGKDVLRGGLGGDTLVGGDGDDQYYVDDAGDLVVETLANTATGGIDTVVCQVAAYVLPANCENLAVYYDPGAHVTGNALDNVLSGGAGSDTLDGGAGSDTLSLMATGGAIANLATGTASFQWGGAVDTLVNIENLTGSQGRDDLTGDAGANRIDGNLDDDTLAGGDGNDTLVGNYGADVLTGGNGADVFLVRSTSESYESPDRTDRITDFSHAQGDRIDLSMIDVGAAAGRQGFTFIGTAAFSADASGQLRYDAATGTLYGSNDADASPEFIIVLVGKPALVAADLLL
jgi:Ca2+-binding RTX toxin-like protein